LHQGIRIRAYGVHPIGRHVIAHYLNQGSTALCPLSRKIICKCTAANQFVGAEAGNIDVLRENRLRFSGSRTG
jgi:hypothetical protein